MFRIKAWAGRAQLNRGDDLSFDKRAVTIERRREYRCDSFYSSHADAVIRCEVAKAVGDQSSGIDFEATHDVWAVSDDEMVYLERPEPNYLFLVARVVQ